MRQFTPNRLLQLPRSFSFNRKGFVDFDNVLQYFIWDTPESLTIDLTTCESANFQALILLIQYAWHLTLNGCNVTFKYGLAQSGPTKMFKKMEAMDWKDVLLTDGRDFGYQPSRQTFALRRRADVQSTINNARTAISAYKIGFPDYLSYLVSELLYNATEHGRRNVAINNC